MKDWKLHLTVVALALVVGALGYYLGYNAGRADERALAPIQTVR